MTRSAKRAVPKARRAKPTRKVGKIEAPSDDLIDASLRKAKVMDRGGYPYLIHPLLDGVPRADPGLLRAWVAWAQAQGEIVGATLLLAPEAMALPLAAALSLATDIPYCVVRKRSYGLPGELVVSSTTGYSESRLHVNDVTTNDRVVVLDDVLSTGGTLDGLLGALATKRANVKGVLVFLDKGSRRRELQKRYGVAIKAMRTIELHAGKVKIVARSS